MKNIWKGMIVGALTGAAAGAALDGVHAAGRQSEEMAARASHRVHEMHVPTRAKHAAEETLHKLTESGAVEKASERLGAAKHTIKGKIEEKR